jgi:hypothetical protein
LGKGKKGKQQIKNPKARDPLSPINNRALGRLKNTNPNNELRSKTIVNRRNPEVRKASLNRIGIPIDVIQKVPMT